MFNSWHLTPNFQHLTLNTQRYCAEEMSFGLSRLRGLAEGLGQEITGQNELIDTVAHKADKTDLRLTSTNKDINAILKK